ncbi:hypothetical protein FQN53_003728 [Emmonsiellopsis sp. PD_33]|nr:hypothetical protein FQN53_003728 [Emmonsiellopsis sp. PD_33]
MASISLNHKTNTIQFHSPGSTPPDPVAVTRLIAITGGDNNKPYTLIYLSPSPSTTTSNPLPTLQTFQTHTIPPALHATHALPHLPAHLSPPSPSTENDNPNLHIHIHILISTHSGTHLARAFYTTLLHPLLTTHLSLPPHTLKTHTTTSPASITDLANTLFLPRAARGIRQTLILLSGDGGVVDLVQVFAAAKRGAGDGGVYVPPTIVLLPLGTGNAMAESVGIGADGTAGLGTMVRGVGRGVPAFVVRVGGVGGAGAEWVVDEGRGRVRVPVTSRSMSTGGGGGGGGKNAVCEIHGAVVFSWALHAALVADSDTAEMRKFGAERFSIAARSLLFPEEGGRPHAWRGKITLQMRGDDGGLVTRVLERREHMYFLATMVSTLEKGFVISPASGVLDGVLRVVHFGPLKGEEAVGVLTEAYQGGKHVERSDVVGYERVVRVRVDFEEAEERWRRVCVDGKILVVAEGGGVEVERAEREGEEVVRLVVPETVSGE